MGRTHIKHSKGQLAKSALSIVSYNTPGSVPGAGDPIGKKTQNRPKKIRIISQQDGKGRFLLDHVIRRHLSVKTTCELRAEGKGGIRATKLGKEYFRQKKEQVQMS